MASSSAPSAPVPRPSTNAGHLAKIFNTPYDSRIAHLNRVLSTAAGIDSTLCFLGYSLVCVSSQVPKLAGLPLAAVAGKDGATMLADLAVQTKTLGGMCSEVRMFMRLWGLLKIWAGAKATYFNPPKDLVLKLCAWGQLSTMAGYLVLENSFFLATKGVIRGWSPEKIGQKFRLAIWVFFTYLLIDFTRLARVWQLKEQSVSSEKEDKIKEKEADMAWWRSLQVDLAYTPLCFHWGFEGGTVGDAVVGFLGACAGFVGFREQLRQTAQ